MLMALAFAPLAVIRQTFHIIEVGSDARLATLFTYFRAQWIIHVQPRMWNVHNSSHRTNNDLEGWHNRFKNIVARHRPNIWKLLNCLIQEQASTEVIMLQIAAGQNVQQQNSRYKNIHRRMKRLRRRYNRGNITLIQFISGISYNLAEFP
jgi:hypothetical protein